jgi:hypothetical protein
VWWVLPRKPGDLSQLTISSCEWAYIASMWMRPITVAETTLFIRQAADVWSDEERSTFVDFIARNPEAGGAGRAAARGAGCRWSISITGPTCGSIC